MNRLPLCLALLAPALVSAQQLQPGVWEMTTEMKMQGMQMPAQKWSQCLSAKDLAEGKQHMMNDGQSKCQMSDFKMSGGSYSYSFACASPEGKMSGQAKGNGTSNSFKTDIKVRMTPDHGMGEIAQIMTGRRTGDCK